MTVGADKPDRLEDALSQALQGQALTVTATASDDVRTAVDQRIGRRARARRTRRALVATASAVTAIVLVAGAVVIASDSDGQPEVATNDGEHATTTTAGANPSYDLGDTGDDPAEFGMPRIGFDGSLRLDLTDVPEPVVEATPPEPPLGYQQLQVFRQHDKPTPLIVVPWRGPGSSAPEHPPGGNVDTAEDVSIDGVTGHLSNRPSGWSTLEWTMPDGTGAQVLGFGIENVELIRFAAGLELDDDGVGYTAGHVPDGFFAQEYSAPDPDEPNAAYQLTYRLGAVSVEVHVHRESREVQEERLIQALSGIETAENHPTFDRPGILASYGSVWTLAWNHQSGVDVNLIIMGTDDRAVVDQIVDGVRELTSDEWFDTVVR
jgi:hypothetical protein